MSRDLLLSCRRETVRLGRRIADGLCPGDLVLLHGPLGAGKTFLARAIVRALGVPRDLAVSSPTFAIVHEYSTHRGELLHADLYRLRGEETPVLDAIGQLGLRERRAAGAIILAEWAETGASALGGPAELTVSLRPLGPRGRSATLDGARAEGL